MKVCKALGCATPIAHEHTDFCQTCGEQPQAAEAGVPDFQAMSMAKKYPKYYKDFTGDDEVDVYLVHHRFEVEDFSGALHHASKKLLLSGVRTGGKSKYQDIKEARDTLNRWLEINVDQA